MPLKTRIRWTVGVPLRRAIPTQAKPALRRAAGVVDPVLVRSFRVREGYTGPIPPRELRANVGEPDVGRFIGHGVRTLDDVSEAARAAGCDLAEAERVLDFGCGCGRLLLPLRERRRGRGDLVGSDVNLPAIDWLQRNLGPGARAVANDFRPPLPFHPESFDAVYSVSIFTHLDEPSQLQWLAEIRRVLVPGGVAILTTHGETVYDRFREGHQAGVTRDLLQRLSAHPPLDQAGFVFEPYAAGENVHSGLSGPYGLTFQTEEHVRTAWKDGFEFVAYMPGQLYGHQDAVVLRRL